MYIRYTLSMCKWIDPKMNHSKALQDAAWHGHEKCVRELIPVSDPKRKRSMALQWAARRGHVEVVKQLIPVSEPKVKDSRALQQLVMVMQKLFVN